MTRRISATVAGLVLMLIPVAAQAGPWPAGDRRGALAVTFLNLETTRLATPAGDVVDIPRYKLRELVLEGSWGIGDRFTVLAGFPLYRYSAIDDFDEAAGVGDVRVGLQVQLATIGNWVIAGRGGVQFPTGDPDTGEGLLPTGSGVWEGRATISIGRSFGDGVTYVFGELGHQIRGGGLRDGIGFVAELGVAPSRRLRFAWNISGLRPYELEPGAGSLASPSGLGDGVAFVSTGPGMSVQLGRGWAWNIDANGSFNARNLATGVRVRTGVTFAR